MSSKKRKQRPSIFVDEHIHGEVADAFRDSGFRVVEVSRDSRYSGRDERDYIETMYASNEIFVTADGEFVDYTIDRRPKHAGVVFLPKTIDEKALFASLVAGHILGSIDAGGQFAMRRVVIYPGNDGLRRVEADGTDSLVISWDRLGMEFGLDMA